MPPATTPPPDATAEISEGPITTPPEEQPLRAEDAVAARAEETPPRPEPPRDPLLSAEEPPAPRPAPPVARPPAEEAAAMAAPARDYSQPCLSSGCHSDLTGTKWVHGPISVAACNECHTQDGDPSLHRFRLSRPKEQLCGKCHEREITAPVVHKPYSEGACLDCHNPHGGQTSALLSSENPAELCSKCHQLPEPTFLHEPVRVGQCLACHAAHESEHPKLVRGTGTEHCLSCHPAVEEALDTLPHVHGPTSVDCSVCHRAHGGNDIQFLVAKPSSLCTGCHDAFAEKLAKDTHVHGALEGETSCTGCHTPHASQYQSQLRAVASELCFLCHNRQLVDRATRKQIANVAKQVRTAKFLHGPVQTGDCQGCHFSHSSQYVNLLRQPYPEAFYEEFSEEVYALCFECHEKSVILAERTTTLTRFRDGDQNLHYVHVHKEKGRSCRACHEPHASDQPSHIRKSVPFGSIGWMLPIGYEKTPNGGKCSPGCHKPKTYDNGGATSESAVDAVPSGT